MASMIELNTFTDSRGSLTVIEKMLPFEIKRVYYIYGIPSKEIVRAGHRHKKNRQALVCLKGSCIISNNDGNEQTEYLLDRPDKCLLLETTDWHTMYAFTEDAVLLVLASENYNIDDYIDEKY